MQPSSSCLLIRLSNGPAANWLSNARLTIQLIITQLTARLSNGPLAHDYPFKHPAEECLLIIQLIITHLTIWLNNAHLALRLNLAEHCSSAESA